MVYYPFAREEDDVPRKPQLGIKDEPEDDGYEAHAPQPAQPANHVAPALEQRAPASDASQAGNKNPQTLENNSNTLESEALLELAAAEMMMQMKQGSFPQSSSRVRNAVTLPAKPTAPNVPVHQSPVSCRLPPHPNVARQSPGLAAPEDPAPPPTNILGNLNFGPHGLVSAAPAPPPKNPRNPHFGAYRLADTVARMPPPPSNDFPPNIQCDPSFVAAIQEFQNQSRLPHHPFHNPGPPQFDGFVAPNAHQQPIRGSSDPGQTAFRMPQQMNQQNRMMPETPLQTIHRLRMQRDHMEQLARKSEEARLYAFRQMRMLQIEIERITKEYNESIAEKDEEIRNLREEIARKDLSHYNSYSQM